VLAIGAAFYLSRNGNTTPGAPTTNTQTQDRPLKTYYDERYGIAFNFPDNYEVKESDATGAGTKHHTIVLGDKAALANPPVNSEGPPVITIDIFPNTPKQTVEKWIKGSNLSNFKQSPDGVMTATSIAGMPAMAYAWDGLYRSTSIVFEHRTYIVMMSVGQNSPTDPIVADFAKVVSSIQLDP